MKIVVLGGSGFIGSHVADALTFSNHKVTIFDNKKSSFIGKKQRFFKGDITNNSDLAKGLKGQEIVYNFAALADIDKARMQPLKTMQVNIEGTLNILNFCKKFNIKKIIHASSMYANSAEGSYYAISKRCAEDYIEEFSKLNNLKYTILRFGSLYGGRADENNGIQRIISNLVYKKKLVYRGEKKAARKYINVKDAARACVQILNKRYENKYLNITGKKVIKIHSLLKNLARNYTVKNKIKFLNEKNTSHYNIQPTPYKIRESQDYLIKNEKNFYESIYKLINQLKTK